MEEEELSLIKRKIVSGVVALTSRTFILQVIAFVSTFILTILLSPSVFGVFFVVSAVISFLSYFSDSGLAAALIQKKTEPTQKELTSVFTLQQLLVLIIVIGAYILSPYISQFYKLTPDGIFLLRSLIIAFLLSSLKTIPSILLERKLEFSRLIIPQILETFSFYLVAIYLAFRGFGISSFAWAAIIRGVVGLIAIYVISPWRISIGISYSSIKSLLSFGIPFQTNSFLALIKDDLMTIFLGKVLPFSQVGYIGWAKKWAETPLRLIMDSIIRVTFPAYSRLQDEKKILGMAMGKSIFFLALFILPTTTLLTIYMKPMIFLVPKYLKWEPALTSFYLFAFSSVMAAFSSPLVNALNALGKIKSTLVLMVIWTTLTWILVPLLIFFYGYIGVAIAAFVMSFTVFIPILVTRKYIFFPLGSPLFKPVIATIFVAVIAFLSNIFVNSLVGLIISISISFLSFGLIIWFWMREEIKPYLPKFLNLYS